MGAVVGLQQQATGCLQLKSVSHLWDKKNTEEDAKLVNMHYMHTDGVGGGG